MAERPGVANSWRIGPDGVSWGRSLLNLEIDANLSAYASPGAWNNPGLLISSHNDGDAPPGPGGAPRRLSAAQVRGQFSMFTIVAAPLLISGSVIYMTPADVATYTDPEAIAISQDALGRQGIRVAGSPLVGATGSYTGVTNVWARPLAGHKTALGFFNSGGKSAVISCSPQCLARAGITRPAGATVTVRDVWHKKTATIAPGQPLAWNATVNGSDCLLFVVSVAGVSGSEGVAAPSAATVVGVPAAGLNQGEAAGGLCMNCSLAGTCLADGRCNCSAGWTGERCHRLAFAPIADYDTNGYGRKPNITAWGADIVRDRTTGVYHYFGTEVSFGCGMASWRSNSNVIHGAAPNPTGPFVRQGVAVPFATNPSVFYDAKASLYRMLILGTGTAGKEHHCGGANNAGNTSAEPNRAGLQGNRTQMLTTKDPIGNWTFAPQHFPNCNNPSGAIHPTTGHACTCGVSALSTFSRPLSTHICTVCMDCFVLITQLCPPINASSC